MTERETPEPLTPEEALTRFEWGRDGLGDCSWCRTLRGSRDEDAHAADCPLRVVRAALRAATPDPTEPNHDDPECWQEGVLDCGPHNCTCRCHSATPDPAEPGLDDWQRTVLRDAAAAGVPGARLWLARSEEPGLDVERLAMATAAVVGSSARDYHREWAVKVAAEYARLARSEEPT